MDSRHKKMLNSLYNSILQLPFLLKSEEESELQEYLLNLDKGHLLVIRILHKILDLIFILWDWGLLFLMNSNPLLMVLFLIISYNMVIKEKVISLVMIVKVKENFILFLYKDKTRLFLLIKT